MVSISTSTGANLVLMSWSPAVNHYPHLPRTEIQETILYPSQRRRQIISKQKTLITKHGSNSLFLSSRAKFHFMTTTTFHSLQSQIKNCSPDTAASLIHSSTSHPQPDTVSTPPNPASSSYNHSHCPSNHTQISRRHNPAQQSELT